MTRIKPFRAIFPENELAAKVSARSADFSGNDELIREIESNPYTYHHVTKGHLTAEQQESNAEAQFKSAVQYLESMMKKGVLRRSEVPAYYIYRQVNLKNGDQFTGLIALCDAKEYEFGAIKRHENVQTNRVGYLYDLLKNTDVLGEPVLLAHPPNQELDDFYRELSHNQAPMLRFISVDRKQHEIWEITDPRFQQVLRDEFESMEALYIADGHHRSHIAAEFYREFPDEQHRWFLTLILPENQMKITPFHRLWRQKEVFHSEEFLKKLEFDFDVFRLETNSYIPSHSRSFGLFIEDAWYELSPKHYTAQGIYNSLDVVILEELIFKSILGVNDSKSDPRICYFSGDQPLERMMEMIQSGQFRFGITVFPPNFEQVRMIADEGLTMPPKSTYIEPKLRAGMIIEKFDNANL